MNNFPSSVLCHWLPNISTIASLFAVIPFDLGLGNIDAKAISESPAFGVRGFFNLSSSITLTTEPLIL